MIYLRNGLKSIMILALLYLCGTGTLQAQKPIFAYARYRESITLPAGNVNITQTLNIDDVTGSVRLGVTAKAPLFKMWMTSPKGNRYPVTRDEDESGNLDVYSVKRYYCVLGLDEVTVGDWTLSIQSDYSLQKEIKCHASLLFAPNVVGLVNPTKTQIVLGEEEVIDTFISDKGTKITNVQIQAQIVCLDDPNKVLQPLPFAQDPMKEAGIFSARFTPTRKGEYQVLVKFEGQASTGHFKRTAEAEFKVAAKTASITGNFTTKPRVGVPK